MEAYDYQKKGLVKKIVSGMTLLLVLGLVLTGCGGNTNKKDVEMKKIGILQIVEHGSLDAAKDGFVQELEAQGYVDGENVEITYLNAQGDQANLKSMSEKLVKENDLVYAIATPSALALLNETKEVPIIISAVTDPVEAGLVSSLETPGGNVTGTTDRVDVSKQVGLLQKINPDIKKVGFIYNAGEANSVLQVKEAKTALEAEGIDTTEVTITSTNDVQSAMESLVKQVDAIYSPTDNTVASSMATIGNIVKTSKTPFIAGSGEMVQDGGLATYGVNYNETGKQSASIAIDILYNGKNAGDIAIQNPEKLDLVINEEMAEALGIDVAKLEA